MASDQSIRYHEDRGLTLGTMLANRHWYSSTSAVEALEAQLRMLDRASFSVGRRALPFPTRRQALKPSPSSGVPDFGDLI